MPNEHQPAVVIPTIHAVAGPTRKRRGEAAEAAFLARALALGLHASTPWGDSDRYDILIDHGDGFWRIQVKCTIRYGEARYRVKNGGSNQQPYSPDEIDFIAACIVPLDVWYIIPIEAAGTRKGLRFYPHRTGNGTLEKYREAWCLLACPPKARGWKDIPVRCRRPNLPTRCAVCPNR